MIFNQSIHEINNHLMKKFPADTAVTGITVANQDCCNNTRDKHTQIQLSNSSVNTCP